MKKEQDGTGSCGPAGEGGCFKRYKANRDNAAREKSLFVESANAAARTAADRLTALKKEKIDKEVELANIVDKARLAGHEITIDPRAGALDVAADLPKKIADLQLNIGKYGIELRQALDVLSGGFTPDKYAHVAERCRNLIPITMVGDFTKRSREPIANLALWQHQCLPSKSSRCVRSDLKTNASRYLHMSAAALQTLTLAEYSTG